MTSSKNRRAADRCEAEGRAAQAVAAERPQAGGRSRL